MDRWEIRMVERAVRQRWNLPPEVYDQIPAKLYAVINDPKTRVILRNDECPLLRDAPLTRLEFPKTATQ